MERGKWSPRGHGAIRELGSVQVMRSLKVIWERDKIFSLNKCEAFNEFYTGNGLFLNILVKRNCYGENGLKGGKSGQGDQKGDYGLITGGMSMAWMRIAVVVGQGVGWVLQTN